MIKPPAAATCSKPGCHQPREINPVTGVPRVWCAKDVPPPPPLRDQIARGPRFMAGEHGFCGACTDLTVLDEVTRICKPCWRCWRWSPVRERGPEEDNEKGQTT